MLPVVRQRRPPRQGALRRSVPIRTATSYRIAFGARQRDPRGRFLPDRGQAGRTGRPTVPNLAKRGGAHLTPIRNPSTLAYCLPTLPATRPLPRTTWCDSHVRTAIRWWPPANRCIPVAKACIGPRVNTGSPSRRAPIPGQPLTQDVRERDPRRRIAGSVLPRAAQGERAVRPDRDHGPGCRGVAEARPDHGTTSTSLIPVV